MVTLTLGPKVCNYYLHWAIWIPRVSAAFMENKFFFQNVLARRLFTPRRHGPWSLSNSLGFRVEGFKDSGQVLCENIRSQTLNP